MIRLLLFIGALGVAAFYTPEAQATNNQTIRFYKVNRAIQADRIKFKKKKSKQAGCHNFLKKARVYKTVQIGYAWCSLYAKKNCAEGSIIALSKDDSEEVRAALAVKIKSSEIEPQADNNLSKTMNQGNIWYPIATSKRGAKIRSWHCSLEKTSSQ